MLRLPPERLLASGDGDAHEWPGAFLPGGRPVFGLQLGQPIVQAPYFIQEEEAQLPIADGAWQALGVELHQLGQDLGDLLDAQAVVRTAGSAPLQTKELRGQVGDGI